MFFFENVGLIKDTVQIRVGMSILLQLHVMFTHSLPPKYKNKSGVEYFSHFNSVVFFLYIYLGH